MTWRAVSLIALPLLLLIGWAAAGHALLVTPPDELPSNAMLMAYGRTRAALPYLAQCAACHGVDGRGHPGSGAPDLRDDKWLHGAHAISEIERTILYGVRSGDRRSRDVADMPAFLFEKRLSRPEIVAVSDYVLALGGKAHDERAVGWGRQIYLGKGVCYDCHGVRGEGIPDYGAPSFRTENLPHGSDRQSIGLSIAQGRHGICPAWSGKLGSATVRSLAVGLYASSH